MSHAATSEKVLDEPKPLEQADYEPLRIWPALLLLAGMVFFRYLPHLIEDGPPWIWMSAAFGPVACGLLILIWWITFSRAAWIEKGAGFVGVILAAAITLACMDKTMLGPGVMVMTIPLGIAAFGIGAVLCSSILSFQRTVIALLLACLGFSVSTLFRSDGMWGNFALGLHWRWEPTSEDALARNDPSRRATDSKPANVRDTFAHPEWPAFRGPERDGRQHGTKFALDWSTKAPELVWKIDAVGPGWSSFAVAGNFLFTQEQRGEMETVVCYTADKGKEVWTRQIKVCLNDPLGGPGPRATPTLADGALYVTFAKGHVMRLNPANGDVVWEVDMEKIANRKEPPMWGFSASPLVVGPVVIVHAGGPGDKGTLAFDKETGELKWSAAAGDHSYASPQLSTILGEQVVLMLTNAGLNILDPATGAARLNYEWPFEGYRALQPAVVDADSIILPSPMGTGTRRIRVSKKDDKWSGEEQWTSRDLKGDFNDFVVYQGHAYGFDGAIFASIDLATGDRNWKEGRSGKGQVLLLEDSGALLVVGEQGEVVLLKADPAAHVELGQFKALTGKTWNHPVVVGDRLYLRNSQEAVCYRLPVVGGTGTTGEAGAAK